MSSAVLYLAIVALWAVVLVPMWLRRDGEPARLSLSWLPHRRPDTSQESPETPESSDEYQETAVFHETGIAEADVAHEPEYQPRRRGGRGAVIARRRRRTLGLTLLLLASVAIVSTGIAPFWIALPPVGLLAGHLSLLRVAVSMDAARRAEAAQARAAERAEARAAKDAAEAAQAEIIDLMERNRARDVFDQYAPQGLAPQGLRAVGDSY